MPLETGLQVRGFVLNDVEMRRIERQLRSLAHRLVDCPDPMAALLVEWHGDRREVGVRLRVRLGHLGPHYLGRQVAGTADHAVRLAIEDVKRQLDKDQARRRGEPSYGVPSRWAPAASRRQRPAIAGPNEGSVVRLENPPAA